MEALKIGEIFSVAWEKFKSRPGFCIGILFIYYIIFFAGALAELLFKKIFGFEPHIISILVGAYASFGVSLIVLDLVYNRPTGLNRFGDVIDLYPKAIAQYVLHILILLLGFVLLIIPGIIFAIAFSMSLYLILEKKAGIIESFKMSWAMTKGHKWTLLLYFFIFVLFNTLGALCLLFGLLVTIPMTGIAAVEIFRRLLKNYELRPTSTTVEGTSSCQI